MAVTPFETPPLPTPLLRSTEGEGAGAVRSWSRSEIDRLVHQLYGLTESEIALVEGRASSPLPVTQERGEG